MVTLPWVVPSSSVHVINENSSALSSQINPLLASFVLDPSPRVNIIPKSLFGISIEPFASFINVSLVVVLLDEFIEFTLKLPFIVTSEETIEYEYVLSIG